MILNAFMLDTAGALADRILARKCFPYPDLVLMANAYDHLAWWSTFQAAEIERLKALQKEPS